MTPQEVTGFVKAALECSVYVAPNDPGLTFEEILEVGKRVGLQAGEIGDAIAQATTQYFGVTNNKLLPDAQTSAQWGLFIFHEDPDYRNFSAFDFVFLEFNACMRANGVRNAQLERNLIVERAVAKDIPRHDIEVAITMLLMSGQLIEKDGLLRRAHAVLYSQLPSEQRSQLKGPLMRKGARARAYPLVKDVIERRTDARPKCAEPLDAFADALDKLGYGPFRLWWKQIVEELRRGDTQSSPVSVSVLAAALVEGALTFVVTHARKLGLSVFGSRSFDTDPRTWRIDDLVSSAASGRDSAILNASARQRADRLILLRQRIHAGRMLSEFPSGPVDLRPDEAREARDSADLVVRAVLDWLQKYPASITNTTKS
jgi:hypothetical protein